MFGIAKLFITLSYYIKYGTSLKYSISHRLTDWMSYTTTGIRDRPVSHKICVCVCVLKKTCDLEWASLNKNGRCRKCTSSKLNTFSCLFSSHTWKKRRKDIAKINIYNKNLYNEEIFFKIFYCTKRNNLGTKKKITKLCTLLPRDIKC